MGYIGAKPLTSEYYFDVFDGDGVTTSWPTTIAPATPVSVIVTVGGSIVDPSEYYFEGSNIYFFAAPAAGYRNIQLRYLSVPTSGVAAPHTYRQVDEVTAYEGQTEVKVRYYDLGYVDVYVNGVQLGNNDFQASDGETILLQMPARKGDLIRVVSAYNTVLTRSYYNQTSNTILVGNGTEAFQQIAPGPSGTILTSNGTNWIASSTILSSYVLPQNAQSTNYSLVSNDRGKHLYFTNSTNANLYIPDNNQVNFPVGTQITIVSKTSASANVTVTPNTGVSLYMAGNSTPGSRKVITYGMATLLNTGSNTWFISGTGLV